MRKHKTKIIICILLLLFLSLIVGVFNDKRRVIDNKQELSSIIEMDLDSMDLIDIFTPEFSRNKTRDTLFVIVYRENTEEPYEISSEKHGFVLLDLKEFSIPVGYMRILQSIGIDEEQVILYGIKFVHYEGMGLVSQTSIDCFYFTPIPETNANAILIIDYPESINIDRTKILSEK